MLSDASLVPLLSVRVNAVQALFELFQMSTYVRTWALNTCCVPQPRQSPRPRPPVPSLSAAWGSLRSVSCL